MNEIEFKVMDRLFFVENFDNLLEECTLPRNILNAELKSLITKGWVIVMVYDEKKQDFIPTSFFDSDQLNLFSFVATHKGIKQHTLHISKK